MKNTASETSIAYYLQCITIHIAEELKEKKVILLNYDCLSQFPFNISLQAQTNEIESLENAPSPVGTPEGLNLSPVAKAPETEAPPVSVQSVGNPIPTLSNFFSHGKFDSTVKCNTSVRDIAV